MLDFLRSFLPFLAWLFLGILMIGCIVAIIARNIAARQRRVVMLAAKLRDALVANGIRCSLSNEGEVAVYNVGELARTINRQLDDVDRVVDGFKRVYPHVVVATRESSGDTLCHLIVRLPARS